MESYGEDIYIKPKYAINNSFNKKNKKEKNL